MKNLFFLFVIGLACIFTSCDPSHLDEPVVVLDPTIIVSASPEVVEYNGTSVISWNAKNCDYVTINGVRRNSKDSLRVERLTSTTKYEVVAVGTEKLVTKNLTVVVDKAPAPTITVTSSSVAIPYGAKTSFSYVTKGLITSVTIDGSSALDSGIFTTPVLYESKEYSITVRGPGGVITQKVSIPVGDWTTSNIGLLTFKPWKLKSMNVLQNGIVVNESILDEEQKTDIDYFLVTGDFTCYHSNGQLFAGCKWLFIDNTHIKMGDQFYSFILTKDKFIRTQESIYNGKPCIYEDVFYK